MKISKEIPVTYAVIPQIQYRWSPRAFKDTMPEDIVLQSLFEAARRSPSAFNGQPWIFIVGKKGSETWNHIFESLIDFNKKWAAKAPVLMAVLARKISENGKHPNHTAEYDTGQAVMALSIQAMDHGLFCHQMTGFDKTVIKDNLQVKDHNHIIAIIAMGYPGDVEQLSPEMQEMEIEVKSRKDFDTFVFTNSDGEPSEIF